jgi:hypothetical protein
MKRIKKECFILVITVNAKQALEFSLVYRSPLLVATSVIREGSHDRQEPQTVSQLLLS